MPDPDLDAQIARYIDSAAPPVAADEARLRAPHARSRRRSARGLIAAVAVVSCIGAVVTFATVSARNSDHSPRVNVGGNDAPASPPRAAHPAPHTGAPLYMAPGYVPPGFTLVRAQGGDAPGRVEGRAGSTEFTTTQFWVRFDAAHEHALAFMTISWGTGVSALHPTQPLLDGYKVGATAVQVRGTTGWYSRHTSGIAWEEPTNRIAVVSCRQCELPQLIQIANSLHRRANGSFDWPAPHDGFELEATAPGMASEGSNVRQLTYGDGHGSGFTVVVADDPDIPPLAQLGIPDTKVVDLRGTQGITGPRVNAPGGQQNDTAFMADPDATVQWMEYPNIAVTVQGKHLAAGRLFDIAKGVREVDATEWARLGGSPYLAPGTGTFDEGTRAAITHAFELWLDGAHPEAALTAVEDAAGIGPSIARARELNGAPDSYTGRVDEITVLDDTSASVTYSILNGATVALHKTGLAINDAGTWKVSRETVCAALASVTTCPPRS
jgi:hypothetical protein